MSFILGLPIKLIYTLPVVALLIYIYLYFFQYSDKIEKAKVTTTIKSKSLDACEDPYTQENVTCKSMPEGDEIRCENYFDMNRTNLIQRRCVCKNMKNCVNRFPLNNGCGPSHMVGNKSPLDQFLHKNTTQCCNEHDTCAHFKADTGLCSDEFTKCLKNVNDYSPTGVFVRNFLGHVVKTSHWTMLGGPALHKCNSRQLKNFSALRRF